MESFTLNMIATKAKQKGYKTLVGEYIGTPKNIIVKDHYQDLGFIAKNDRWHLDLEKYEDRSCFIKSIF
jgi:predicted enzyme involved in methoxymalonyl-ACP biosynthesis